MRRLQSIPSWLGIISVPFKNSCASGPACFIILLPEISQILRGVGGGMGSDELEQKILEVIQALVGVPQGSIRSQLGSQEEQLPVLSHGAQRQGFMQL